MTTYKLIKTLQSVAPLSGQYTYCEYMGQSFRIIHCKKDVNGVKFQSLCSGVWYHALIGMRFYNN